MAIRNSEAAYVNFDSVPRVACPVLRYGVWILLGFFAAALLIAPALAQTTTTTVSTSGSLLGIAVNPASNKVYAANSGTNSVTVYNAATGATGTLLVGANPSGVAVNPVTDRIYVTNSLGVTVIDGSSDTVIATVSAGSNPTAIATNVVTDRVYVANSGDTTATVIDGSTNTTATISGVGSGPNAIAVNPVTNRVYITTSVGLTVIDGSSNTVIATPGAGTTPTAVALNPISNLIYVANSGSGDVMVFDGATSSMIADIAVGGVPEAVIVNPVTNKIYTANQSGYVSAIDGATNQAASITAGTLPMGIATNIVTNQIYVTNNGDGTVTVIDGNSGSTGTITVGSAPLAVGVNPVANKVYVGNAAAGGGLTVIDGAVNASTTVAAGNGPSAVAVNPATGKMYVANATDGTVTVINELTQAETTVTVGTAPAPIAVNPATNQIFVANTGSNSVSVIDGTTDTLETTITTGSNPSAIAVDPLRNIVYAANAGSQDVTVIDGTAGTAITTMPVGTNPEAIALNATSDTIYVANFGDGTVSVIDGPSRAVVSTVGVGAGPRALDVNSITNKLYVANSADGTVSVIDGAANTVDATVSAGANPQAVAVNSATNKVYVANEGGGVSILDPANDNNVTTIDGGEDFVAIAVNVEANRIYAVDNSGGAILAIDGWTNASSAPVSAGSSPVAAAVDPVTGIVFVVNSGSANATAIAPNPAQNIPFVASVQGVSDAQTTGTTLFSTSNANPSFTATVNSSFSPNAPPPTALYYQLDSAGSGWAAARLTSGAGSSTAGFQFGLSGVPVGLHTLYVYAAYGNEGTSTSVASGSGNSPETGNLTANLFEILPTATSTTVSADVNPQNSGGTVTFTAQVTPNFGTGTPSGSVIFLDGSTPIGQAMLDGSSHATFATSALSAGTHDIAASYLGSAFFAGSTSSAVQELIAGAPASVTVASGSGQTSAVNSAFAAPLVVLVADSNGTPVPLAAVSFSGAGLDFANGGQATTNGAGNASVVATPTAGGALTAVANVNGAGTPAGFSLTGVAPPVLVMAFSPNAIPLNGTSTLTFTITNPAVNTTALTGVALTNILPIGLNVATPNSAGGNCGGTVAAQPGSQSITLSGASVATNSNCTAVVNVIGEISSGYTDVSNAVASANGGAGNFSTTNLLVESGMSPSSGSLTFGNQVVGTTSAAQTLTLTNNTTATVTVNSAVVTGDFSQTNTCGSVAPTSTCSVSVSFVPSATGALSGSLIIDDSAGVQVVLLSGTGVAPGVGISPASWNFGSVTVGAMSAPETITVTNAGTSALSITNVAASGDFTESDNCASVSPITPGNSCAIQATFQPTATGTRNGALTITGNAGTQVVSLTGTGVAAGVGLSASTLTFGSQVVGTTSVAQSASLTNTGSSNLAVNSFAASGDFVTTSSDCAPPLALAQGLSCTLQVVFAPQAVGVRNGAVTISDSVGTHVVALTGTGVAPGVGLSHSTLSFANQLVGTTSVAQSVTATNTGTSDLAVSSVTASGDFAATGDCVTASPLAPNATCNVDVTFSPVASGPRTGTVTISDSAGTHIVALSGTGVTPGIGFSPPGVSFGSQIVGTTSAPTNIIVTNTGTSSLSISAVTAAGDFAESDTCRSGGALIPNATCTVSVTFTPVVTGARAGSITVDDSLGSQVISLTGTGSAPGATLSPTSLTFGSETVNTTSSSQSVTLMNNGSSALSISSVTVSGDYAETDTCTSSSPIAANDTCALTFTFTPTAAGTRTGTAVISDGAGTQIVSLTGTGAAPGASLSPTTLSFGSITVGNSAQSTASVNLSAGTSSSLTVADVSISGDYTFSSQCTSAVAPGSSCSLSVTFSPTATGIRTGTVLISYTVGTGTGQLVLALTGTGTAPGVGLSPSMLNFGSQTVGIASATQTVALSNTGTSSLAIATISASGDFSETNNCPATVASGGQCTVSVTFTPVVAGARAGAITITDGAGTQVVALSGTGIAAGISLSSSTVNFGPQVVGTTSGGQAVTFSNTGAGTVTVNSVTAAGDFAQTNNCSTITAGNHCTISITFTPSTSGARTGTVAIVDSAGTQVIATSGTGTAPGASLSTSTVTYGSQTVGTTSAAQTVTLTNSGASALTVSSFSTSGDFAVSSSNCGTLPATAAAGSNCQFQVTFIPSTTGTRTGSLILGDSVGTQVVSLSGTGSAPGVSLAPSTVSFGTVTVGSSSQQTANVLLDIATASSMQVTGVSVTGDYTIVNNCTSTVSPGGSCSVSVTFNPAAVGTRTGTALISYTAATTTSQLVLALIGTGTAPGVSLSPSSLTFGSQVVSTTSTAQSSTLTNTGTSGLTGITITAIGDFSQTNNCGNTAAGANCTINVTFSPTATGLRTGYMVITDNAGTQVLALTGTGTAPGVSVSPTSINFGGQVVGTTTSASTVTVTNSGTSTLTFSSVTASGDFAISSNGCGSVTSGNHCTFQVTFSPTATGARTGTVTIVDGVGTQVVALTGTGNAPGVTLSTGLVNFGNYTVGTVSVTKTFTLTNTGTSSLTVNSFTVSGDYSASSSNCATLPVILAVNGSCTLQVVFAPTATGTRSGNVAIADSVGTHVVALTGVGLAPGVALSPTSLSFGSVNVGTSAQSTANINLDGSATGALTVSSMTISGDYQLVNNCGSSVAPGGACSLNVTFTPTVIGDRTGTVVISYTLGTDSGQLILPLDGAGLAAEATVAPSSLAFGSQLVGTTSTAQTVTLTNNGTATLTVSSVAASGDFAMTNSCGTLAAGINCSIQVTFTPTASGTRNGTLTITDELGTQVVALSGTGTAAGVTLSHSNLNFGNLAVGSVSGGQSVTVTNTGNSTLIFTSITAAGDYAETDNCSSPINQNASCTITVTFAPTEVGTRNGTIALFGNAETQVIQLTGTGTSDTTGTVSTPEMTFAPQQVGTTSNSQQVTFTNTSGAQMTVSNCTIAGDFLITSGCTGGEVLQTGDSLAIDIAFQPTAPGNRVGFLQINDTGGTQQVTLEGTGLQSGINVSPVNLNFGNQTTDTNSTPQLVTLTNTGGTDLTVTSVTTTAEFTVSSSTCGNLPADVAVSGSCVFAVTFNPASAGTASGTMTIVDSQGTQTVGLNGTGVLPGVLFSQSPLSFGSQTVGTSSPAQITTLTNSGLNTLVISSVAATGDYSVTSSGCLIASQFTLPVGGSCDLDVTFSPVVAGTRVGALTVTDNDGIQAIAMSGNGTVPGASLSASNLNFGQVIVGASAQMTTNLNLSSSTTGSLRVTSITLSGNFTETDNCTGMGVTVVAGGSCFISVTFSPVATGAFTGAALIEYTVGSGSGELVLQLSGTGTTPGISLSPSSESFGTQVINTSSTPPLTVQLSNTGTSGLTVSSITAAGDFTQTNNCASIPVGSSCSINITFTPTGAQALTGAITITHDSGTAYAGVAVVPLGGTGVAPGVSLSPASVTFGTGQTINTSSSATNVTLTNNGTSALHVTSVTAAGDFSQTNTCSTVNTNATCTISVTFSPKAAGSRSGSVTIKDDAGTQVVALSGTGTQAGVSLSAASVNFGSQTVNTTSAAQSVTVTNNGGSTLTITSYQATGDFAVSSANCTTVSAGANCTLQITFTPTLTGTRSGSVAISDNAGGQTSVQLISLTGQGTAPGISLSPSTLNFGSVAVGSTAQLSVTILLDAASDASMTVNFVTVDGDFGVTNNCTSSVSPGGQCSMLMTFTPTTTGARTGQATIAYTLGSGTNQLIVALSGTGLAAAVSLTPSSLQFGSQVVGTISGTQVVTLRNTGNSGLTGPLGTGGPVISINGDFAQTNNCSGGLSVGGSCTITVSFSPATTGTRNGIINISDNLGLQTLALTGSGTAPGVTLNPATVPFGSQIVGTTSGSQSVTVTNSGTSSLSFTSIAASGDFAQTNTCTSALSPNGTCSITVTFTPQTTGTRNGTVTLVDNAGSGTQVVTLSGTGTAPGVSLTATTLAFGSQIVNTTSASQSVTLTNNGTSSLTITSVTADSDYAETDTCTSHSPLAANATCTITVTFAPQAAGGRAGAITIVDGAGTQVIALSGTGTAPGVSLSSSSLNFGSVVVNTPSTPQNVTLTNTGTSTLSVTSITGSGDFSETDTCISHSPLPPSGTTGNSCTITITFTPVATGPRSGAVTITDGVGEHFVALTGTGDAPGVQLSASTLTFGSQTVDTTSGAQTVTLTNSGNSSLAVSSFTTGGDFAVSSPDCPTLPTSLAASGICTLQITFTPAAAGTRTGTVAIGDSLGTQVIALTGTGAAPGVSLSPATLSFGSVTAGSTSQLPASVLVSLGTSSSLTVTGVTIDGDYSVINNCTAAVSPGNSCNLSVTFAPTATGTRKGTAQINYTVGSGSGELILALSGTGTAPGVSLSPPSPSFGSQVVSTASSSQSVTVTNNGTSTLTFTSVTTTGDFTQTNGCTASVSSNGTCSVQIVFAPTVAGARTGTVTIVDNAGTQTIALSGTATAPGVTLAPTSFNFGSVVVSSTSSQHTITLTDTGTSTLTIASITPSAEFGETNTCGASLAASGGTCNINATFSPAATGARNGTLTIVDGAGTHVVTLSGTGTQPGVSLTSTSLSFSNQVVNTTSAGQTVTLTNNGTSNLAITSVTASGDFADTTTCSGSIAQNGTCTITVKFTPTASGGRTGAVTIVDAVGTQVISLSGTGITPGVSLSSTSLTFGNLVVNATSASQMVTLTNTGTSSLAISTLAASGDFAQTNTCVSGSPIAANGTCTVTVTFTPTATGTRSGAITINDAVGTQSVALTGVGQAPAAQLSASSLTFSSQLINTTSAPQNVTLTNNGTSSLTVSSVTSSGDFAQTNTCVSGSPIAANGTCTVTVTFTPTAVGTRSGAVTIVDAAGTQAVGLSGTGTAPGLSLAPTTLSFGNQGVSTTSAPQSVLLTNSGTSSLSVSVVSASGDFSQTNNCVTVAATGTCTLNVSFAPTSTGARTGTLAVTTSAGLGTVSLSGNGTATGAVVSQSSVVFGSQALGTTSLSQSLTLTNTGTTSLNVSSVTANGDFAQSNNCSTLSAGNFCTVQVTFTPTATGTRNGALTIVDSAASHTVVLSGVGFDPTGGLSASNLTFGSQTVGTTGPAQIVTFTNQGPGTLTVNSISAAGDFAFSSSNCASLPTTLAAGAVCSIAVTFSPQAIGSRSGELNIADTNGTQFVVLSGTGTAPGVTLSPANLVFGSVTVGTSTESAANVSVDASMNGSMTVTGVTVSGDFGLAQNLCGAPVNAGGECALTVMFSPAATGVRTGTAVISYTVGSNQGQLVLALSGTGSAPGVSLAPSTINFGSVTIGTTSQLPTDVDVDVSTNGPAVVTGVMISGDFSITQNLCTNPVVPGGQCGLSITFAPSALGTRTGIVLIDYAVGSDNGELVLALSGTSMQPGVALAPSSIDFGTVTMGTTSLSATNVTVDPSTNGPATLTGVTVSGDFAVTTNGCTSAVNPGGQCGLGITFAPATVGLRTGIAVINYSVGSGSGQMVLALTGTGAAPGVSLSPSSIGFGSVTVGTSAQSVANVIVDPSTAAPITVTSVAIDGDFSVGQNLCTSQVGPGAGCGLSIVFSPAAPGTRTGTAVINYIIGSVNGQLLLALSGNGTVPGVGLSPSSLDFGSVVAGTSSQQTANVAVDLTTDGAITVTNVTSSGDFTVASQCNSPVSAGGECGLSVTFAPAASGLRTGSAIVNYAVGTNSGQLVLALSGTGTAPVAVLSFPSVNFGTQVINTTSDPPVVSLQNNGTSDLSISSVTTTGDFSQTGTCGSINVSVTVAPGGSCSLQVTFTPSAAGARTGTITIVDNAGTQVIALTGTGSAPGVALDNSILAFVPQVIETTSGMQTVTVTNTGTSDLDVSSITAAGDFAQTNNCPATLPAQANCQIAVTFTPAVSGTRNGTVTIADNEGAHVVALTGTGQSPVVALAPVTLAFANQLVGTTSAAETTVVSNTGTSQLTVLSVSISGDFAQTNNCTTIPPSGNCSIQVTFTPLTTGARSGSITVSTDAGTNVVSLSGTGIAPQAILSPGSLTFTGQDVGTTSTAQGVQLSNMGTSPLVVSAVSATGNFSQTNTCATIAPAGTCTIQIQFTPTVPGLQNGTITLSANALIPAIALSGTGLQPDLQLLPSSLAFPSTSVSKTSAAQTIVITNTGTTSLAITSISPSAEFLSTNNCSASLQAGGSCNVTVTFAPSASGLQSGTLTIVNNGGSSPLVVPLVGTGADFTIGVRNGSNSASSATGGGSATYQAVVSSLNYNNLVNLVCVGAPPAGTCSVQPASVQMTGSNSGQVTITVTTAASSQARNVPSSPQPIGPGLSWLAGAVGMIFLSRLRVISRRRLAAVGIVVVLAIPLFLFVGCSRNSPSPPSTPAGTYQIVVVGNGGDGLQRSLELTLTVN